MPNHYKQHVFHSTAYRDENGQTVAEWLNSLLDSGFTINELRTINVSMGVDEHRYVLNMLVLVLVEQVGDEIESRLE